MGEFELIRRYFTRPTSRARLGIGDDAALLAPDTGQELAVTTDMLVEGRHFFPGTDAFRLGWKSLAVNLSDLAAMGAQPHAITLALALREVDPEWLDQFAKGLFSLADRFGVELIGGDTTAGPLTICITAMGNVPSGQAHRRCGARVGDDLWVSDQIGGAALRLYERWGETTIAEEWRDEFTVRMEQPIPRVDLGLGLRGIATSAIDLSDGLTGDLGHILDASGVGAEVRLGSIPCADDLKRRLSGPDRALAVRALLAGGDDYELLFTAPRAARASVERTLSLLRLRGDRIGEIVGRPGLTVVDEGGAPVGLPKSFDHFASENR